MKQRIIAATGLLLFFAGIITACFVLYNLAEKRGYESGYDNGYYEGWFARAEYTDYHNEFLPPITIDDAIQILTISRESHEAFTNTGFDGYTTPEWEKIWVDNYDSVINLLKEMGANDVLPTR